MYVYICIHLSHVYLRAIEFDSQRRQQIFSFAKAYRPAFHLFIRKQSHGRMKLTTLPYEVPRLRMCGALPPLPYMPSWCGQRLNLNTERAGKI
jgi:hypothetical protein